ncbi:hypothetical protein PISMIDRAFT_11253 [Pisolithus microcarpus 441]|uniref:Uncharacterized protein n=1 Tax=Pisolithus microcarpus 441 TaxID=765257 RepID=A0A0C9ZAN3_9AGAM|nr:hypothetical protein PISMIDRAFT_11253 [Pisolithus microcarpus 441]
MAEVLDQRLGEVVKALEKNMATMSSFSKDIHDLKGVLEESSETLDSNDDPGLLPIPLQM